MQIKDIMSRNATWLNPDDTVRDAAIRMRDEDIGALPVGDGDTLVGMLTDRDIVVRQIPEGTDVLGAKVGDVMSEQVLYCFEDQEVDEVAANMGANQVRRLPMMNRDKRLVGMVSLGDIALEGPQAAGAALSGVAAG